MVGCTVRGDTDRTGDVRERWRTVLAYLALVRLLGRPLLLEQEREIIVAERGLRARPGAPEAAGRD